MSRVNIRSYGFTLIEILVVLTIISLMAGIGYMSFSNIHEQQLLKKAVTQLHTDLYEAKQTAFLGKKPNDDCKFMGTQFTIVDENTYWIDSFCEDPDDNDRIKEVHLDNGVTITDNLFPSFSFSAISGVASREFGFSITAFGNETGITIIYPSGEIR